MAVYIPSNSVHLADEAMEVCHENDGASAELSQPPSSDCVHERSPFPSVSEAKMRPSRTAASPNLRVETSAAMEAILKQIFDDIDCGDVRLESSVLHLTQRLLDHAPYSLNDTFIKAIVSKCVKHLGSRNDMCLSFNAALVLTIITSESTLQTKLVVDAGAVDALIALIRSCRTVAALQAIWTLGNIIGDSPTHRDLVISKGAVQLLGGIATAPRRYRFLRKVDWAMSNFFRCNSPPPAQEVVEACLPVLAKLINNTEMKIVSDVCCSFSFITAGPTERVKQVLSTGVLPRLVELLDCKDFSVIDPCLQTLGNICGGSESQIQWVVDATVLPRLYRLLESTNDKIVSVATWVVLRVTTGTPEHIAQVIRAGLVESLLDLIRKGESRVQKDAADAIKNITLAGSNHYVVFLFQSIVIPLMLRKLDCKHPQTIPTILIGLQNMLTSASNDDKSVAFAIKECGGLQIMAELQTAHKDGPISNHVNTILKMLQNLKAASSPCG